MNTYIKYNCYCSPVLQQQNYQNKQCQPQFKYCPYSHALHLSVLRDGCYRRKTKDEIYQEKKHAVALLVK